MKPLSDCTLHFPTLAFRSRPTRLAATLLVMLCSAQAQAQIQAQVQTQDPASRSAAPATPLSAYVQAGYLPMGQIFTPLLHTARTGQPYDRAMLLKYGQNSLLPEQKALLRQIAQARDEFAAREPTLKLDEYLGRSLAQLKENGAYLVPLGAQLQSYDFARGGFPVSFAFANSVAWSDTPLFCSGRFEAHDQPQSPKKGYATVCLSAPNLARGSDFHFLPMADQQAAQALRTKHGANALQFYAVAHVDGRYQAQRPYRYLGGQILEDYWVAGVQPLKALEVLVVDKQTEHILARVGPAVARSADGAPATETVQPTTLAAVPPRPPQLGAEVLPEPPKVHAATAPAAPGTAAARRHADAEPAQARSTGAAAKAARTAAARAQPVQAVPEPKPLQFPAQEQKSVRIVLD